MVTTVINLEKPYGDKGWMSYKIRSICVTGGDDLRHFNTKMSRCNEKRPFIATPSPGIAFLAHCRSIP